MRQLHGWRCVPHIDDQRDAEQDRVVANHIHVRRQERLLAATRAEEDRWLNAFITHDGLYEWVRMPFGLKNAGATFVRAVRSVLKPM